jgi:hypothetical protein
VDGLNEKINKNGKQKLTPQEKGGKIETGIAYGKGRKIEVGIPYRKTGGDRKKELEKQKQNDRSEVGTDDFFLFLFSLFLILYSSFLFFFLHFFLSFFSSRVSLFPYPR